MWEREPGADDEPDWVPLPPASYPVTIPAFVGPRRTWL